MCSRPCASTMQVNLSLRRYRSFTTDLAERKMQPIYKKSMPIDKVWQEGFLSKPITFYVWIKTVLFGRCIHVSDYGIQNLSKQCWCIREFCTVTNSCFCSFNPITQLCRRHHFDPFFLVSTTSYCSGVQQTKIYTNLFQNRDLERNSEWCLRNLINFNETNLIHRISLKTRSTGTISAYNIKENVKSVAKKHHRNLNFCTEPDNSFQPNNY